MKRILISLALITVVLQMAISVLGPVQPTNAHHVNDDCEINISGSTFIYNCAEVAAFFTGNTPTDAVINWHRATDIDSDFSNGGSYEVNSGTLTYHSDTAHYHSAKPLAMVNSANINAPCPATENTIIFEVNGIANYGSINMCENWLGIGVVANVVAELPSLDSPPENGSLVITINDLNGTLTSLQQVGITCAILNLNGTQAVGCHDPDRMTVSGMTITFINVPIGTYNFVISYLERCLTQGECYLPQNGYLYFDQTTTAVPFNINGGETTYITIDVSSYLQDEDTEGRVPPEPAEPALACDGGQGVNALEWLLCPLSDLLFKGIDSIYRNLIIPLLYISPLVESDQVGTPEYEIFQIWNGFRTIANVLFVVVFLAAILGQSLGGFRAFSAYETKKILPRLVIGVIGVQLSWYLVAFTVDAFNVIGASIRALMLAPVDGLEFDVSFDLGSAWEEIAATIGIIATASAALVWGWGGLLMGIPLMLFSVIMGMILVFITVLARKILVLLLIITAPVAFTAWVLPNTVGMFKKWWEYLWKALFMYPLIVMLISAGELFAKVITAGNLDQGERGQESVWLSLAAMVALFAPYFLIPLTFRFAGSAFTEIANGFDKRNKGLNRKIFGSRHDPNSYRGKRAKRQREVKMRHKSRRIQRAENLHKNGRNAAFRQTGRMVAFLSAKTGADYAHWEADQLQEARKWLQELTGSARDEAIYRITGPYNPVSGGKLSRESTQDTKFDRKDRFKVQAVLEYEIGKANTTGSGDKDPKQVQMIYDRFMNGEEGPDGKRIKWATSLKDWEKERAFSLAADRHQSDMGDYKYRDPKTQKLSTNLRRLGRFATEINHRKSNYRSLATQRDSYWGAIDEMQGRAQQIYTRHGGDGGFDASKVTDRDERKFLTEMRDMRRGFKGSNIPTMASPAANKIRADVINNMSWLDNQNLDGLG